MFFYWTDPGESPESVIFTFIHKFPYFFMLFFLSKI